jgi:putative redox protein
MNQMTIQLCQVSATLEATLRTHHLFIDRPREKGGVALGPMGGELFLASIGGCLVSNLLAAISAREAEISEVHAEVIGTIPGSLLSSGT